MAKQIEGVYERILDCAKEEFLAKGFKDASLRVIAKNANTSTGSIYTRFKDKNGLFEALVKPVTDMIKDMCAEIETTFEKRDAVTQSETMAEFTSESDVDMINFIYDHKDIVLLLVNCAYGTKFENFLDEFIEIEANSTIHYLKVIGHGDVLDNPVLLSFIHTLAVTYCRGMLDSVLNGLSREEAHAYVQYFNQYHTSGFNTLFKLKA